MMRIRFFLFFYVLSVFCAGISFAKEEQARPFLTEQSTSNLKRLQELLPEEHARLCAQLKAWEAHFQQALTCPPSTEEPSIPRKVHFIWIGPRPVPPTCWYNMRTWHEYNPDYQIFLWTDREHKESLPYVTEERIDPARIALASEYAQTVSYSEKADILRLEILCREGGIYADVDVECHRSFDPLLHYHFFASAEDVWPMITGHYLRVSNALFGVRPHHPILQEMLNYIQNNWKRNTDWAQSISMDFELNDHIKMLLAFQRTFLPFTDVVIERGLGPLDLVAPSYYFGMTGTTAPGLFCTHYFEGNWKPDSATIGKNVVARALQETGTGAVGLDNRLTARLHKTYRLSVGICILCGCTLFCLVAVVVVYLLIWGRNYLPPSSVGR